MKVKLLSVLSLLDLVSCVASPTATLMPSPTSTPLPTFTPIPTPYWPTEGWKTSSPEGQGVDSEQLAKMFDAIQTYVFESNPLRAQTLSLTFDGGRAWSIFQNSNFVLYQQIVGQAERMMARMRFEGDTVTIQGEALMDGLSGEFSGKLQK